jgi:hypothetical protein
MQKQSFKLFGILVCFSFLSVQISRADVLFYAMKGSSAKGTKINDGTTTAWSGIPKKIDVYLINDLDGVDASNPDRQITRLGKTFYPSLARFDHLKGA